MKHCAATVIYHSKCVLHPYPLRLADGDTEEAMYLLGHPFSIKFPVVKGKQLGRSIGIPTINQEFPEGHIIPKRGIYACTCNVGGDLFLGVANIGVRPTVSGEKAEHVNCETHIIHYNGLLYGKEIQVDFYRMPATSANLIPSRNRKHRFTGYRQYSAILAQMYGVADG